MYPIQMLDLGKKIIVSGDMVEESLILEPI